MFKVLMVIVSLCILSEHSDISNVVVQRRTMIKISYLDAKRIENK